MKIKSFVLVLFAALAVFMGCTDSDDSHGDMGKLIVQITDAPFPHDLVAEANVTIFKIDARQKDHEMEMDTEEEEESDSETEGEDNSPFIILMEEEVQINLLELTNGLTEQLVNTDVPVGTYDLIRIYVKGINIVLTDGTTFDLNVPSGEQTGIKVFIKPGIVVEGGLTADLLLDFDVSKSFVPRGNKNDFAGITGFNFKPVIKACNKSTSGTLAGLVTTIQEEVALGLEGAQVAIFAADTLNTTTFTDETGAYMVLGLTEGTYDVEVELEGYGMQTVEDIEITAANKTIQDFELTAVP